MPYYRRNIYILSISIFLAAASWTQVVPFLPLFLRELGAEQNLLRWVGIVFAAHPVAGMLFMPYWGKLGDSYGRKPMIIRAGLCLTAIYFGMSFCTTPWQLVIFRFLNGALTGFIPSSITLLATNTPEDHAPRAVASAQTAVAAGTIVGPAIGGLLASLIGYRGSMRLSGIAVLISTLLVLLLVKEPNKVKPSEKTSLLQDFTISMRSPILSSILLTVMIGAMFAAAINPVLTLHLENLGGHIPAWLAGVVFSLPGVAFIMSAHLWTHLGERKSFERVVIIGLIGGAIGSFLLTTAHSIWLFASLYFAVGLWLAAISPSTAALICSRVDESFRGRAYGMQTSATMFGSLIAPLAATQIGTAFGIPAVFMFVGTVFIIGLLLFRVMLGGWPKKEAKGEVS